MGDGDADGAEAINELEEGVEGFEEGVSVEELRADVGADSFELEVWKGEGSAVDGFDFGDVDAEFVVAEAGGDVGVGGGVDVWVDAEGDAGGFVVAGGDGADELEFGFAFAVEGVDAGGEGVFDLVTGFADAGEDDFGGVAAGLEDAEEFAAGDDVKAGTGIGEEAEDR